jgi:Fe-S oxidoreductase
VDSAGREILGNIPALHQTVFFLLAWLSLGVFSIGVLIRARLWFQGRRQPLLPLSYTVANLSNIIVQVFAQPRLSKSVAGLAHAAIFWGFLVLFVGTNLVALEYSTSISFLHGLFYLLFSLSLDIFGVLMLVGLGVAAIRRFRTQAASDHVKGYGPALLLLGLIGVTGFLLEGARMSLLGSQWFDFSPVGAAVAAGLGYVVKDEAELVEWHRVIWWSHAFLTFGFIAYLPFGRMLHTITATLHLLVSEQKPSGVMTPPFRLEEIKTGEVSRLIPQVAADLHWTQLLSLDACTECGLCDDSCPALSSGRPLSPRNIVVQMRGVLNHGLSAVRDERLEEVVDPMAAWSCTTCGSCVHACPVAIRPMDLITDTRRSIALNNGYEPGMDKSLINLCETGNPFGFDQERRMAWAADLTADSKPRVLEPDDECELLLWVGCWGAFDERGQKVTRSLAALLARAKVNYAVLGAQEQCTGDSARRLGEEGLFQQMAVANIDKLRQHGIKKIVTACPHCLNSLSNEYTDFGADFEVIHHSQLISELVDEGRLVLEQNTAGSKVQRSVTYHDPCYLGRHNGVFEQPRELLSALPSTTLTEMAASRELSRCCGAGGSNAWFDLGLGKGMNTARYGQAAETGAQIVATSCPFCLAMLDEAGSALDAPERIIVKDIAELVEDVALGYEDHRSKNP